MILMKTGDYIFILVLVLTTCLCVYLLLPAYTEYDEARSTVKELDEQSLDQDLEARELREQIHSLQTDPDAIERVAREKLGWCREDEKIYHFDPVTPEENDE
jgi:cell division protein FtsB